MESFEHSKLTLAGYKADDDGQRVEVFRLNPFSVKPLHSYYMLKIKLESEIVGQPMEKQMFMPTGAFSWELGHYYNGLLDYWKNEKTNPGHLTIKSSRK